MTWKSGKMARKTKTSNAAETIWVSNGRAWFREGAFLVLRVNDDPKGEIEAHQNGDGVLHTGAPFVEEED